MLFVGIVVDVNALSPNISEANFLFCTPLSNTTNSSDVFTNVSVISVSSDKSTLNVVPLKSKSEPAEYVVLVAEMVVPLIVMFEPASNHANAPAESSQNAILSSLGSVKFWKPKCEREIVPVDVIVPPVRPVPVATDVTVPEVDEVPVAPVATPVTLP